MHNQNVLQLTRLEGPEVPARAFAALSCLPGKVAVEMAPPPDQIGSILMPERVGDKLRPDVGTVLACTPPKSQRDGQAMTMNLRPGDTVLVRPYDGAWFEGFERNGYRAKGQVRLYGIHGEPSLHQATQGQLGDRHDLGESVVVPWSESIVAKVVCGTVLPTNGNVLVQPIFRSTFFQLPDGVRLASQEAVVLASSGTLAKGSRIVYRKHESIPELELDLDGLALIIRQEQVMAVVI